MIEVRDLKKSFGPTRVLDGVSLEVRTGESIVIIGRSGGGKSILLKHLIGLLQPDAGQVLIDQQPIVGPAVARFLYQLALITRAKTVFEMGSAIGYSTIWWARAVGEGAPAYSSVTAQTSPDFSTAEPSAEITTSTSEVISAAASSSADLAQEGIHTIEGEVMAASWKNIRDSIAGAAAKPAPTKEEFRDVEPASADSNTPTSAEQNAPQFKASDPTAIANIVDSVLAELRPKIVEEIARKLADSKKE
jgi:energy-coupling factor transporter ATP-binding protein EcfA2